MKRTSAILIIGLLLFISSCYKETFIEAGEGLDDWGVLTHSSLANPDYSVVFPQDKVNRFDITISENDWENMQSDLDDLYGGSTSGGSNVVTHTVVENADSLLA